MRDEGTVAARFHFLERDRVTLVIDSRVRWHLKDAVGWYVASRLEHIFDLLLPVRLFLEFVHVEAGDATHHLLCLFKFHNFNLI